LQDADVSAPAAGVPEAGAAAQSGQGGLESLLDTAQQALSSMDDPAATLPPDVRPFEFKDLAGAAAINEPAALDLLRDVQLDLKIELGRAQMYLEDVLRLKEGAVVTLDKLAGDPVDIYANGRLIARGEVLVLNDSFCVRVADLVAGEPLGA
jgi:flagellar motor switch protein FliN/FliY